MTNKEQIKCKYKFQDKEKFDGKTYCTCFCELCEDSPLCDDNCQIYEDFKQLTSKTLEYEKYKKLAADFKDVNKQLGYKYLTIKKECEQIKEKYEALKLENQEGYEIVAEGQSGHSDARTTLNNYAKCNDTMVKKAMEVYENKFKKCEQNVSIKIKKISGEINHRS